MRDELISEVVQRMLPYLDNKQLVNLQSNLNQVLQRYDVEIIKGGNSENDSLKEISQKRQRNYAIIYTQSVRNNDDYCLD